MVGEAAGDLRDGELRGRDDGTQSGKIAALLRPAQTKSAGALASFELDAGVLLEPEARRLQDRRNRRADDVLTVVREIGVAARGNARKTIAFVPVESDLEHGAFGSRPRAALSW